MTGPIAFVPQWRKSEARSLATGIISLLYRRTGDAAIGAKYAAITFFGFEKDTAALAIVEPLAGIRGHGFGFPVTAFRAANL